MLQVFVVIGAHLCLILNRAAVGSFAENKVGFLPVSRCRLLKVSVG